MFGIFPRKLNDYNDHTLLILFQSTDRLIDKSFQPKLHNISEEEIFLLHYK